MSEVAFKLTAPGKIILTGEHSVLYKKKGIAVSISRRTSLSFREKRDSHDQITIRLVSLDSLTVWDFKTVYDLIIRDKPLSCDITNFSIVDPSGLKHDEYIAHVNEFLHSKSIDMDSRTKTSLTGIFYIIGAMLWCSNVDLYPFDIEIKSDLVMGAGTGSSASFAVCISAAFYHYLKLKAFQERGSGENNLCNARFKPYVVNIQENEISLTKEDCDVINRWAFCVERIMHGKPSGLDNTVCTYGSAILINANDSGDAVPSLEPLEDVPNLNIILINSGVERKTSELVKKVSDLREVIPEAMDSVLSAMDTVTESFVTILKQLNSADESDLPFLYKKLERLIDVNQGLLVTIGVTHPRLDEAVWICRRRGLSCKLTGAGGGGFAFALVPPCAPRGAASAALEDLQSSGFAVQQLTIGAPGLSLS